MKMKKMLAILAALSVLGTTGLTVGAEDTAATEPAVEEGVVVVSVLPQPARPATIAEAIMIANTALVFFIIFFNHFINS